MHKPNSATVAEALEILELPSLLKIITFTWKRRFDDLGHQARNYFFGALELGALQIIPDTSLGPDAIRCSGSGSRPTRAGTASRSWARPARASRKSPAWPTTT